MRQVNLSTVDARSKLPVQHKPHWRQIERGLYVGYHKGERSRSWRVRRFVGGRYKEDSLGTVQDEPTDGLTWGQATEQALAWRKQQSGPIAYAGTQTVRQAHDAYFEWRRNDARSKESTATDEGKMKGGVLPEFGNTLLSELNQLDLQRWLWAQPAKTMKRRNGQGDEAERERRAKLTANRTWTVFRAILNYAHKQLKWVGSNAAWASVQPYSLAKIDKPRERFLTEHECSRLLGACAPDFALLVRGALETGMRYGELCTLRVGDVRPDGVFVQFGKTEKSRRLIPLSRQGMAFFKKQCAKKPVDALVFLRADGKPWTNQHQKRRMNDACIAADVKPRAVFHDLRRSYGSLLINSGMSLQMVSQLLGHKSTRMTERVYAHLTNATKATAVQQHLPTFRAAKTGQK